MVDGSKKKYHPMTIIATCLTIIAIIVTLVLIVGGGAVAVFYVGPLYSPILFIPVLILSILSIVIIRKNNIYKGESLAILNLAISVISLLFSLLWLLLFLGGFSGNLGY